MYKKGEVMNLTFEWKGEGNWLSTEKKVSRLFDRPEIPLEDALLELHFVSAAACGGKDVEKLVLFYTKPL